MEASTLTHVQRRNGLLAGRSKLLRLQKDERLIALVRSGHQTAFETLFDRYQQRLLAFCRHMLRSREDAEDVLQEVFVAAYNAILADDRPINARPWLYRIARNRCLNHLRKPTADGQETMDHLQSDGGTSTAERVQRREEFRQMVTDVQHLPETQRTALLLRELEALSYEEIAHAMDTTIPSVKSLLVRARISLAECSQARMLTCSEVQVELAEAAEGLAKVTSPARRHVRECERCGEFRKQLRRNDRVLASALLPIGPLIVAKQLLFGKLGLGAGAGAGAAAAGGAGGAGLLSSAIGAKTAAGLATAAILTAGAVEVKRHQAPAVAEPATERKAPAPTPPPAAKPPPAPAAAPAVREKEPADPLEKRAPAEEKSDEDRAAKDSAAPEAPAQEKDEKDAEKVEDAPAEQPARTSTTPQADEPKEQDPEAGQSAVPAAKSARRPGETQGAADGQTTTAPSSEKGLKQAGSTGGVADATTGGVRPPE